MLYVLSFLAIGYAFLVYIRKKTNDIMHVHALVTVGQLLDADAGIIISRLGLPTACTTPQQLIERNTKVAQPINQWAVPYLKALEEVHARQATWSFSCQIYRSPAPAYKDVIASYHPYPQLIITTKEQNE